MASNEARTAERRLGIVTQPAPSATREVVGGSARVFIAEAISLPTGLVTAAYLARQLGPSGYGVFTLAVAIVGWMEWTLTSLFARASVRVVADADDWRPAAAIVLRIYAVSGAVGLAILWGAAGPLATVMHEPTLTRHVRVLALDVPLFMLSQAHQQILVGTGAYGARAIVGAWRWTARLVLVLVLVGAGLSIDGGLAAIVGASVIELIAVRRFVKPGLRGGSGRDARAMWTYAIPLVAAAIGLRLFDKLDLFALKALGASAAVAGWYGAAQNLTVIPNLIAISVTTLLLSTLTRAIRNADADGARVLAENALRGVLVMFPFAAVAAGAATAVSTMIYGDRFAGTGPLLAVLIFAALVTVLFSVASVIVTAAGRPRLAMVAALPVAPLALVGYLVVIPRFGATGATVVTLIAGAIGMGLALVAVHRIWRVRLRLSTVARVTVVTLIVLAVGVRWQTSGFMAIVELTVMSTVAAAMLVVSGELTSSERQGVLELTRRLVSPVTR